jgi:PAS domain S-box-containing protein
MNSDLPRASCPSFDFLRRQLTMVDATAKFYSAAFDQTSEAMVVIDDAGRVHAANAAACRLHAVDRYELVGLLMEDLLPPEIDLEEIMQKLLHQGEATLEFTENGQSGSGTTTSTRLEARRFRPHRYVVSFRDITWERRLEKALERAHGRETMCHSAAGVLHDVNNLLVPIVSYADALVAQGPVDGDTARMLGEIRAAAERAAALARKLMSMAQPAPERPAFIQINDVLDQLMDMLKRVVGDRIELVMKLDPELAQVRVDRERLERVLLNLVLNARDAMPDGGTLTLQTANLIASSGSRLEFPARGASPDRHYTTLSVSDTGLGMDTATRERIFEPFFTTKPPGMGTGLGLSSALSFVSRNDGYIEVDTEPGRGTTFRIGLPQVKNGH